MKILFFIFEYKKYYRQLKQVGVIKLEIVESPVDSKLNKAQP
jgi:hypothetical protein